MAAGRLGELMAAQVAAVGKSKSAAEPGTACGTTRVENPCRRPRHRPDVVGTLMETSTSIDTARRNLAQRIERFLAAKRDGILTAGEATNIAVALACLENGRYADGEDAMMLAEKDWRPRGELGKAVPVEVLAARLEASGPH